MINEEIGKRLRTAREEKGIMAKELAEMVGLSKSTVSRYETGDTGKMKLPIVEKIADVLGVNPVWLIGESDIKYLSKEQEIRITDKEKNLVLAYRNHPEMQGAVCKLLDIENK